MGNREALLTAAKKCLLEKGYNRTTARDIASSAGVSLAAIGYHFSSKDALLTEALLLAFGEWDQELQQALRTTVSPNVTPAQRFETTWAKLIATFETHRPLWIANFEIFTQMVSQPATREFLPAICTPRAPGWPRCFSIRKRALSATILRAPSAHFSMCFSPGSFSSGSSIPRARSQPKLLPKPCAARLRACAQASKS